MEQYLSPKMAEAIGIMLSCVGTRGIWADPTRYRNQCWTRDFVLAAMPVFFEPEFLIPKYSAILRNHLANLSARQRNNGQIPILFLDQTLPFLWEKIKKSFRDRSLSFMLKRFMGGELWNLTPGTKDSEILYIIGMYEYTLKTDDREFLMTNMHRTFKALRYAESRFMEDGLLLGCDWRDTMEKELATTPLLTNNSLLYHAYRLTNQHKKANALLHHINRTFWKNGTYIDYPESNRFDPLGGALAVLYDVVPPERYASIIRSFESVDTAAGVTIKCRHNPISPEEKRIIDETDGVVVWPFVVGFTILALIKMQQYEMARDQLHKLIALEGFREWYDPRTGRGYGAGQQMWSAALFLRAATAYLNATKRMQESKGVVEIRTLILNELYQKAVDIHGQGEVRHELIDMIHQDLADKVLNAAHSLGYADIAKTAAHAVNNSASYGQPARNLARQYL